MALHRLVWAHGLLLCQFLLAGSALANGASSEFPAGGIVFRQEPDISIAREDLDLSLEQIHVHYVFFSKATETLTRTIGFPMPKVEQDDSPDNITQFLDSESSADLKNYMDFKVSVNGVPVEPKRHEFAWNGEKNITSELKAIGVPLFAATSEIESQMAALPQDVLKKLEAEGLAEVHPEAVYAHWQFQSVYEWPQDFAPGKTEVEITYVPLPGYPTSMDARFLDEDYNRIYCVDDAFIERRARKVAEVEANENMWFPEVATIGYILRTANYWAGPIGEFNLSVEDNDNAITSLCVPDGLQTVGEGKHWTAKDFTPNDDLKVLYLVSGTDE